MFECPYKYIYVCESAAVVLRLKQYFEKNDIKCALSVKNLYVLSEARHGATRRGNVNGNGNTLRKVNTTGYTVFEIMPLDNNSISEHVNRIPESLQWLRAALNDALNTIEELSAENLRLIACKKEE